MPKHKIFITGIGTEVGKTVFSALLLKSASNNMVSAYFKPIETGGSYPQDYTLCSKFAHISFRPLYHFKIPASPHISAKLERGKKIDPERIKKEIENIERKLDDNSLLVIEGAGGLLVPLKDSPLYTWADLISEIKMPIIVVSASYLGSINHTLCTVEVLKKRKVTNIGVVLNFPHKPKSIAERTNEHTLKRILSELYLGKIPYVSYKWEKHIIQTTLIEKIYKAVESSLWRKIFKLLRKC